MKSIAAILAAATLAVLPPAAKQKAEAEGATDAAFLVAYSAMAKPAPAPAPKDTLPVSRVATPVQFASLTIAAPACESCAQGQQFTDAAHTGAHDAPGPVRRVIAAKPVRRLIGRIRDRRPVRTFVGRLFCRGCQ